MARENSRRAGVRQDSSYNSRVRLGNALVLLIACGDDRPIIAPDAALSDAGSSFPTPALPAPPAEPALADFGGCPTAWTPASDATGTTWCEPPPRASCAHDEASFVNAAGCTRIGPACPSGDFAEGLPATNVLYVRRGGTGDGSLASPFGTIREALVAARSGTTIAVARGTYDEPFLLPSGVRIVGACVEETVLDATLGAPFDGVITSRASGFVAQVTIRGERPGVWVEAGADLVLEDVLVEGTRAVGVFAADGGRVTGRRIAIRDVRTDIVAGNAGRGASAEVRGVVILEQAVIERCFDTGVVGIEDTTIELTDVAIRDTRLIGGVADGMSTAGGGVITGRRVVVEGNGTLGVYATQPSSRIELEDAVIRDNVEDGAQLTAGGSGLFTRVRFDHNGGTGAIVADGDASFDHVTMRENAGRGLTVQENATATLSHALLADNGGTAILATGGAPNALTASDVILVAPRGAAITIQTSGGATIDRMRVDGSLGTAVTFRDAVTATARDLVVRDAATMPDGRFGRCVEIRVGANATLERFLGERCHEVGVFVEGSTAMLSDVTIRRTEPRGDMLGGRGLEIEGGTSTIARLLLEEHRDTALMAGNESTVTATDVTVRETLGSLDGLGGHAITANGGASLTLERVLTQDSREAAVVAFEAGTELRATSIAIVRNLERACAQTTCAGAGGGIGAGAYLSAHVDLRDFRIVESALCGVQVAGGTMDLADGEIAASLIGANVQTEGFDVARLTENVTFREIERNIDVTVLPVPDPTIVSE